MNLKITGLKVDTTGEGTRGGKVIGHTSSGKPIYMGHKHLSHEKFTIGEHKEAVAIHEKGLGKLPLETEVGHIRGLKGHKLAIRAKKKVAVGGEAPKKNVVSIHSQKSK